MSAIAPDTSTSLIATSSLIAAPTEESCTGLPAGMLRSVHHIALNVKDMQAACHFYGNILGLHRLTGDEVPATLVDLVAAGQVTNFKTPDGTILDLFWTPEFSAPEPDSAEGFTRADHLAFDIAAHQFDQAMERLTQSGIHFKGPVVRPTGRGIYFPDPDGFIIEVRCNPT